MATDFGDDGSIPGWSRVTGIWLGGAIDVLTHTSDPPAYARRTLGPRWTTPPGPKPIRGWPRGSADNLHNSDTQALRDTDNCVSAIVYRPTANCAVMVVAATDVDEAESVWRPVLGQRLRIVQNRWSKGQLAAVTDELVAHWADWTIGAVTGLVDEDSQSQVEATVLRVVPAMAAWATAVPQGLLQINPTLRPTKSAPAILRTDPRPQPVRPDRLTFPNRDRHPAAPRSTNHVLYGVSLEGGSAAQLPSTSSPSSVRSPGGHPGTGSRRAFAAMTHSSSPTCRVINECIGTPTYRMDADLIL